MLRALCDAEDNLDKSKGEIEYAGSFKRFGDLQPWWFPFKGNMIMTCLFAP